MKKSSKYFCNLENRSWQKKNIHRIKDDEDNVISDPSLILKNIHKFYSKLYSNQGQNEIPDEDFFNSIDTPKLSEEGKVFLDQPLSKQELYVCN